MPKDSEEIKGKVSLLVGLIGGAIVGAAAALLLSPKTGKENRRTVGDRITQGRERISKGVEKIRNRQDSRDEEKV